MLSKSNDSRNAPRHGPQGYAHRPVIDVPYAMRPEDDDAPQGTAPEPQGTAPKQLEFAYRYVTYPYWGARNDTQLVVYHHQEGDES